jgi:Methyl-accepting chemotaxis protein
MGGFKFRGIRAQLLWMVLTPAFFMALFIINTKTIVGQLEASIEKANTVRGPLITYTGNMATDIALIEKWLNESVSNTELEKVAQAQTEAQASLKNFEESFKAYNQLPTGTTTSHLFKDIQDAWPEVQMTSANVIALNNAGKKVEAAALINDKLEPLSQKMEKAFEKINAARLKMMEEDLAADNQLIRDGRNQVLLLSVVAALVMLLISGWIMRKITSTLTMAVSNLVGSSENIASASEQLFANSEQVAQSSTEGAASIEECVASLEEVTSMVRLNANHGQAAAELAKTAQEKAAIGEKEVTTLISSIREISESSEKIHAIIAVIDDIAFQTNLLSLNASIEAARAGEHGKGFSVVAEAVRQLAQRSATSAKEISELLGKSLTQIQEGAEIADRSGVVFREINEAIKKVAEVSSEVAQASHEQEIGVVQMNTAMSELDGTTQNNAAASEEVASSAQELAGQAIGLQDIVEALKEILDGKESGHNNSLTKSLVQKAVDKKNSVFEDSAIVPSILSKHSH